MHLNFKVVPDAARHEISGWLGDALKIRVRAALEKDKANQAVVALLATAFGMTEKRVTVEGGLGRARKQLYIDGMDATTLHRRLDGRS